MLLIYHMNSYSKWYIHVQWCHLDIFWCYIIKNQPCCHHCFVHSLFRSFKSGYFSSIFFVNHALKGINTILIRICFFNSGTNPSTNLVIKQSNHSYTVITLGIFDVILHIESQEIFFFKNLSSIMKLGGQRGIWKWKNWKWLTSF